MTTYNQNHNYTQPTPTPRSKPRPKTVAELFPSLWLKAADLRTKKGAPFTATVIISAVDIKEIRQRDGTTPLRAILSFQGKDKQLILNKTQAMTIADIFHTERFEDWVGKTISLSPGKAPNGKDTIIITRVPASNGHPTPAEPTVDHNTGELFEPQRDPDELLPLSPGERPGEGQGRGEGETNLLDEFFGPPAATTGQDLTDDEDAELAAWHDLTTRYDKAKDRCANLRLTLEPIPPDATLDQLLYIVESAEQAINALTQGKNGQSKRPPVAYPTRTETDMRVLAEIDMLNQAAAAIGMSQMKISDRITGPELERMRDRLQIGINAKKAALAGHTTGGK